MPIPKSPQLGKTVRNAREQASLTVEAAAKASDIGAKSFYRLEKGERDLSLGEARVLAETLRIPVEELDPDDSLGTRANEISPNNRNENESQIDGPILSQVLDQLKEIVSKLDDISRGIEKRK